MYSCFELLGESTGLYFFSAVFQGNMSLLALIGVFVVFKIQQLNSSIQQLNDMMLRFVRDRLSLSMQPGYTGPIICKFKESVPDIDSMLAEYLNEHHPLCEAAQNLKKDSQVKRLLDESKKYNIQKTKLTQNIKTPFILILITILLSLTCLPIIHLFHQKNLLLEITVILIEIIFCTVTLLSVYQFIKQTVREESYQN